VEPDLARRARRVRLLAFDFDGVFTDNRVLVLEDGREAVLCSRADGLGLARARAAGLELVVISTETNPVVGARCRKLAIECVQGCTDKLAALRAHARRLGIGLEEVAYLGNDINDLDCLRAVGLPACVADAWPEARAAARLVTARPGGTGAVREFCETVLALRAAHGNAAGLVA